jgi:hypothetical protein
MTVLVSKPAVNLREELASLRNQGGYQEQQFWFAADGTLTDFAMENGWKPLHVFNAGLLQKEGSGDEYEVIYDGFTYTVSFNVAPANGNDIGVIGVKA